MVEYDRNPKETPPPGREQHHLCIVGIGGAGSNVLDRITLDRTVDADLVCVHTDVRVLSHAMAPTKIQLGEDLMRGIGAGGDPDLGREAALFSKDLIREEIEGHDIVFICAGLGGGTGSGAAPVVAEIAKGTGALVIVVATMPFSFEGRRRLQQAQDSLDLLQKSSDALVLFENNRMGELILPKDGIQKAFSQADQLIAQSLRAVSTMISTPGLVKLGLDDLTRALASSQGRCLFGFGEARGQNRGADALKRALKSPLIDQGRLLNQTENLLVHVAGGDSLTLVEVEGIMKQLGRHVPDDTQILFGVAVNPKLGDSISVTLISSLGIGELNAHAAAAPPTEMLASPRTKKRSKPVVDDQLVDRPIEPEAGPKAAPVKKEVGPKRKKPEAAPPPWASDSELFEAHEPAPKETFAPETPKEEPPSLFPDEFPESAEPELVEAKTAPEKEAPPPPPPEPEAISKPQPEPVPTPEPDPEPEPEPEPAAAEEPVFEEEPPEVPKTSLAEVVANSGQPLRSVASADLDTDVGSDPQPSLSLGGEDRGRFKDTEQMVVEGEDLDVPTWMRLRKKLKR